MGTKQISKEGDTVDNGNVFFDSDAMTHINGLSDLEKVSIHKHQKGIFFNRD